jgi:hypothetical protein
MSVVSRKLDNSLLFPQRRVYTAPEHCAYSRLPYLDPNNLSQKILEDEFPPDYALPLQKASQNVYDPTRRPSDNLTIHMNHVPLQFQTYDMLDSRRGASVFNAPIPDVHPKLRTKADFATASYMNELTKEQISFHSEYAKVGDYPSVAKSIDNLASFVDSRRPITKVLYSKVNEPIGMTFKETFNGKKAHRNMNAQGLAPELQAEEQLRHYAKTGRWT